MSLISKFRRDAGWYEETPKDGGGSDEPPATEKEEEFDKERALATIRNLRQFEKDAKALKKKLDEIEAADAKRKDKELGETEKERKRAEQAEQRLQDLETRQRETTIRYAVEMAATKLNFHDAQDAYRLADLSTVDIADDGKVNGVDTALAALTKAKPHLVKSANADINAQNRGRNQQPTIDDIVATKRNSGQYAPL